MRAKTEGKSRFREPARAAPAAGCSRSAGPGRLLFRSRSQVRRLGRQALVGRSKEFVADAVRRHARRIRFFLQRFRFLIVSSGFAARRPGVSLRSRAVAVGLEQRTACRRHAPMKVVLSIPILWVLMPASVFTHVSL